MRAKLNPKALLLLGGLVGLMLLGSLLTAVAGPLVSPRQRTPAALDGALLRPMPEPELPAAPELFPEAPEPTEPLATVQADQDVPWPGDAATLAAQERAAAYRLRERRQPLSDEIRDGAAPARGEMDVPWARMLTGLLAVVAVICLGVFALKKLNGGAALHRGRHLDVLEARPLGGRMHLYLVRVAGRVVLIAAQGDHATPVTEFAEEELPAPGADAPEAGLAGFKGLLKKLVTPAATAGRPAGGDRCGPDASA